MSMFYQRLERGKVKNRTYNSRSLEPYKGQLPNSTTGHGLTLHLSSITVRQIKGELYAAVPETHRAAQKEQIALQDLAKDEWILFAQRVHPVAHEAILDAARREGIAPRYAHDTITSQESLHLVSERVGVAILTKPKASHGYPYISRVDQTVFHSSGLQGAYIVAVNSRTDSPPSPTGIAAPRFLISCERPG
jgi:DNA-binding transcriptional LysR family regulator